MGIDRWCECRLLLSKMQDEVKALQLCQTKIRQKKLPMEVIDAEYQWCVDFLSCLSLSPCFFFITVFVSPSRFFFDMIILLAVRLLLSSSCFLGCAVLVRAFN